ncbi:MAG: septum formation initiator family protein [Anaerolineae bacterium]
MEFPKLDRGRIAAGAVVLVVVLVVGGVGWAFVQQLTLAQELRNEARKLEAMVATREAERDQLTVTLAYVQTDEYVEKWAREELKMARPGEVVVIPMVSAGSDRSDPGPGLQMEEEPVDALGSRPFWIEWWEALFGP